MEQVEPSQGQLRDHPVGLSFQPDLGWWIATDDKWYPPELHPDYLRPVEAAVATVAPSVVDESTVPGDSAAVTSAQGPLVAPVAAGAAVSVQSEALAEPHGKPSFDATEVHGAPGVGAMALEAALAVPAAGEPGVAASAPVQMARKVVLTTWEHAWYIVLCVAAGFGYFAKIPAKKAMEDFRFCRMTSAEHFWYIVMCIPFGAGYLAKIPTAKALSELPQLRRVAEPERHTL